MVKNVHIHNIYLNVTYTIRCLLQKPSLVPAPPPSSIDENEMKYPSLFVGIFFRCALMGKWSVVYSFLLMFCFLYRKKNIGFFHFNLYYGQSFYRTTLYILYSWTRWPSSPGLNAKEGWQKQKDEEQKKVSCFF